MPFQGKQKRFCYIQSNYGPADKIFPLLCPVKEKEWLDGWNYTMVHSKSGFIEKNCVFTTPHHGEHETVWHVTEYDPNDYRIEFLRVSPGENTVRINIDLEPISRIETNVHIRYEYTALNEEANFYIENQLKDDFCKQMKWWEKSMNHYLKTGEKLLMSSDKTDGGDSEAELRNQ